MTNPTTEPRQPRVFGLGDTIPPDAHRVRDTTCTYTRKDGVWRHDAHDGLGGWAIPTERLLASGVTEVPGDHPAVQGGPA